MTNVTRTLEVLAVTEPDGTVIKYLPIETRFSEIQEYIGKGYDISTKRVRLSAPIKDFLAMAATTGTLTELEG